MGIHFSCPFPDLDDLDGRLEAFLVRSLSFDGSEVGRALRSVSFNGRDSEPSIMRSFSSGRMILGGSLSFKGRELETTISFRTPSDMNREIGKKSPTDSKTPKKPSLDSSNERYQAALRLQKVYKSFRTRRQLADCAVLVEQRWWKLLDFAELKRSSISFFDIEKPETAVSRWSRARTRAAKVGKGLSKDQRARKLALQHWLEAIDPRHRYGHNLQFYYVTWLHCESKQPFFYWLDIGEGKEVNLERCPRSKIQQQCIKYLGPTERKAYEVAVEDGKFFYKQSGTLLDTRGGPQDAKWIFVLSTSKTLYVGQKHKGTFQHSSFLAGGATLSAGRLVVEDGILKAVWPHIGHYLPTEKNFEKFILFLEEHNVDLSIVQKPTDEEDLLGKIRSEGSLPNDFAAPEFAQANARPPHLPSSRFSQRLHPKELRLQLNRCSLEEETSVEIINPSMDEKLDSSQLDPSEQQTKNAMETPERKCATKREITIKDLQPLFGRKRADAAKILDVSVSTFKRHCRRNGIKWENVDECSLALELDPKHRETPGEKTTPSCKTPSITGQAETGNQVLDSRIVEIEGNLQEQNCFQMDNVSKEELRLPLNRCSLEEETSVEIINPSMDGKLDSSQLDPSEQQTKNAMETPERKCATKREITIKDLQPLFGRKRADAAKILDVSVSTFKRHCRFNGIKWWNGGKCSRAFELDPKHRETPGEKTTPSCKTPSITGRAETGNQVLDSSIADIEGNLQEQNSFQMENVSKEVEGAVSEGDSNSSWPMLPYSDPTPKQSVVTVKATYGEDTVKFDLSSTPKIVELKEEVAKRLELESGSFKVKYQDADQEWILIGCDADFQQCLRLSSSLGNPLIRLLVIDKVFNFGKSSKRCRR